MPMFFWGFLGGLVSLMLLAFWWDSYTRRVQNALSTPEISRKEPIRMVLDLMDKGRICRFCGWENLIVQNGMRKCLGCESLEEIDESQVNAQPATPNPQPERSEAERA